MDSTIRKWVSELANDVNAITPDARISKRYLFEKIKASADYYIKQIAFIKLIRNNLNYSTVPCFEMETVPAIECCSFDIPNSKTVQRSVNKVAETYGSIIRVFTLDNDTYKIVSADSFKNILDDEYYNPNDRYAWIENKHLIIPNSDVETVKLSGYFINKKKAMESGCGSTDEYNCYSALDEPFDLPSEIKNIVMKDALQSILTKLQIPKDETPNSNLNQK